MSTKSDKPLKLAKFEKAEKAAKEKKPKPEPKPKHVLKASHFEGGGGDGDGDEDEDGTNDYTTPFIEIGVDEAGRGPMFGRVYVGAVVLPKDAKLFDFSKMKDSKKFTSDSKIKEAAEYIKTQAIAWSVVYAEHDEIDRVNIRRATIDCMHKAIRGIICDKLKTTGDKAYLLIDGCDFIPMMELVNGESYMQIPHLCVEGGDNTYAAIAAASILAKVARDEYIGEMCCEYPELVRKIRSGKQQGIRDEETHGWDSRTRDNALAQEKLWNM